MPGRHQTEAQSFQFTGNLDCFCLIGIAHTQEGLAAAGQLIARAELGFGEGLAERAPDPHHFSGGFHFRPQQWVYPRELDEGISLP